MAGERICRSIQTQTHESLGILQAMVNFVNERFLLT